MKTFCVLPWIHLATLPDGYVTLCCNSNHTNLMNASKNGFDLLNLNNDSIYDIINSEYFKKIRLEFLKNNIPIACKRCFDEESNKMQSKRLLSNTTFKHFNIDDAKSLTSTDGTIKPNLKFIELRLGNKCNHKCISCNPCSSSMWESDYKKMSNELDFITKYDIDQSKFDWTTSEKFWNELGLYSDNLEQIYVNGGEPTLIKEHWLYIKHLISKGKTNIKMLYSINASYLPKDSLKLWKKFKDIEITCSVDDVDERNSYIRYGSNWETINKNIDKLLEEKIDVNICQTISFLNYLYLDEFLIWLESKGLQDKFHHNIVYQPDYLSPSILPLHVRNKIHKKFEQSKYKHKLLYLKNIFSNKDNTDKFNKAMEYINLLDKLRDKNFSKIFSELLNLIKG